MFRKHLLLALSLSQLALVTQASPLFEVRDSVCQSGVYGDLTPYLSNYPPAQAFCKLLYKPECTTAKIKRQRRAPITSATSSTSSTSSKTTTKSSTYSTTSKITTTSSSKSTTSTSSKPSSTTTKQDPKSSALSKLSGLAASAVKTLCSCIQSHPACTTSSTSTTSTKSTTTSTKSTTTSSTPYLKTSSTSSTTTSSTPSPTTTSSSSSSSSTSSSSSSSSDSTSASTTSSAPPSIPTCSFSTGLQNGGCVDCGCNNDADGVNRYCTLLVGSRTPCNKDADCTTSGEYCITDPYQDVPTNGCFNLMNGPKMCTSTYIPPR